MYPIFIYREPEKCPKCHNVEHKKEVCAHCGYMYPEEGIDFVWVLIGWISVIGTVLGVLFIGNNGFYGDRDFLDYAMGGFIGGIGAFTACFIFIGLLALLEATFIRTKK